ncbi:M20/M25/M40 family metallo-hydrolase [Roseovarius pacificus]|uniref:M20/M25/M40 family metallo-hydrolase n=1 Tax=Roseovarius pacificus TaxID=337701 RepID=UPI002A18E6D2|nr:M20/M25/M40 family metallo-hydrolase [Roseovarius pacificus]
MAAALLGLVLFVTVFAWWMSLPPNPVPKDAPPTAFSAERAFAHVAAMAKVPHPVGSKANDDVAAYIVAQLEAMGVEFTYEKPIIQRGQHNIVEQAGAILARIPGTASTGALAIDAHFDSTPYGPGAADDLSGCAAMLETIRALKAGPPLQNDIVFCFADKEEHGGEGGPGTFIRHPWFESVRAVLGLETRGSSGPALMFETGPDNGFLIRQMAKAGVYPRATSIMFDIYDRMPFGSDFSRYKRKGLPGLNVAYIDDFCYYHTMLDNPAHLDLASLQHHGAYTLGLSKQLGSVDLSNPRGPDASYFNTLGSHMIVYPRSWGWPITIATLCVFGAALLLGLVRRRVTVGGMLGGMLLYVAASVVALVITAGLAWLVFTLFQERALYRNNMFSLSIVLTGVGILVLLARPLRGRIRAASLFAGLLLLWAVALVIIQVVLPGGAYAATVPLFFMSFGLLALVFFDRALGFVLATVSALPAVALLTPTLVVLSYTLTAMAMPMAGLLVLLLVAMFVPLFHLMPAPRHTRVGLAAVALAGAIFLTAVLSNTPSPERPLLNCLSYAVNYDTGEAFYVSQEEHLDEWTRNFFDEDTPRASLDEFFGYEDGVTYLKAPAPPPPFDPLKIEVLSDETVDGRRKLRLHVESPMGAQEIYLRLEPGVTVYSAKALGIPMDNSGKHGWFLYLDTIPHDGGVIELEVEPGEPLVFKTREEAYQLPSLDGFPPRPGWMMTQTNRVLFRHRALLSNHTYAIGTKTL